MWAVKLQIITLNRSQWSIYQDEIHARKIPWTMELAITEPLFGLETKDFAWNVVFQKMDIHATQNFHGIHATFFFKFQNFNFYIFLHFQTPHTFRHRS